MSPKKSFPLQQGNLDSLCMPYAVLNALHLMGGVETAADAEKKLKVALYAVSQEGDLFAAITEGFDPVHDNSDISDVNWVARIVSPVDFLAGPAKVEPATLSDLIQASHAGCILYFENADDDEETHYTFVIKDEEAEHDTFQLWDSFGFVRLRLGENTAHVDDKPVRLRYAWPTILPPRKS